MIYTAVIVVPNELDQDYVLHQLERLGLVSFLGPGSLVQDIDPDDDLAPSLIDDAPAVGTRVRYDAGGNTGVVALVDDVIEIYPDRAEDVEWDYIEHGTVDGKPTLTFTLDAALEACLDPEPGSLLDTVLDAARERAAELDRLAENPHTFVAAGQSSTAVGAWARKQAERAATIRAAVAALAT